MKKRVLFIAYYFPPMGGAPAQRTLNFIRYLPPEGYLPEVITGPGRSNDRWAPGDRSLLQGIPSNVSVFRIKENSEIEKGGIFSKFARWCLIESSFSKWWKDSAVSIGESLLKNGGFNLIYASMSPFQSSSIAASLSNRYGIPWVADLRDAWALDEIQLYPSYLHRKIELMKMYRVLKTASLVIMNTPQAKAALLNKFPDFISRNVACITNGFDSEGFKEQSIGEKGDRFRIVHTGSFFTDLGLEFRRKKLLYRALGGCDSGVDIATRSHLILLEAMERWSNNDPDISRKIEIVMVGNASKEERRIAGRTVALDNLCRFTGYVSREESLALVRSADLLFLAMHNLPEGRRSTSIPSKMYDYMASGRPILAAVPDGDARDWLKQCGTAFLCRPDDVGGMLNNIRKVYTAWQKGIQIVTVNKDFLKQFDRRVLTKRLAEEFDKLLG